MSKTAAILLAPGFEEIEAITPIDILRRASFEVVSVGTVQGALQASRSTIHIPDTTLDFVLEKTWDLLILPGGAEGTANLKKDGRVQQMILRHHREGKWIAAICAAPTLLFELGLLDQKKFTSHPSVQSSLPQSGLKGDQRVVVSDRIITSLAAGSAMEFSYEIVRQLLGEEQVRLVDQGVCSGLLREQN